MLHSYCIPRVFVQKNENVFFSDTNRCNQWRAYMSLKNSASNNPVYNILEKQSEKGKWLQQLLQCRRRINASQMKDDESPFFFLRIEFHKSLRTLACAGRRGASTYAKTRRQAHMLPHVFSLFNAKDNLLEKQMEPSLTMRIVQLMTVNNPNECYNMSLISICIGSHGKC